MAANLDLIGFDGDDTLWENETLYVEAKQKWTRLLTKYSPEGQLLERLDEVEVENTRVYGYGIKSFMLSMLETAIELSQGRIAAHEALEIIGIGREMLTSPVRLLSQAEEVLSRLSAQYRLMLVTKGDRFEQERKIGMSGLRQYFQHVEVVGDKNTELYRSLLERHGVEPTRFLMVGNSLRSDVFPVVALGGWAVFIHHPLTWPHEMIVEPDLSGLEYDKLQNLSQLPEYVDRLART